MKWFWVVMYAPLALLFLLAQKATIGTDEAIDFWQRKIDRNYDEEPSSD